MKIKICKVKSYGFVEIIRVRSYRHRSSRGQVAGVVHYHTYYSI